MSISGRKLLAETTLGQDGNGDPAYLTAYRCTSPIPQGGGNFFGAGIVTPIGALLTETLFNSGVAADVAADANQQTSNVDEFVSGDVFGGRV